MLIRNKRDLVALYGIDRLTIWVDVPLQVNHLPATLSKEPSVTSRRMRMNPQWKSKIELSQPTHCDLAKIHDALAGFVQFYPNYVELNIDLLTNSYSRAYSFKNQLFSAARFLHVQNRVSAHEATLYVGKRSALVEAGVAKKEHHVIAAYCDRPSKDSRAMKYPSLTSCMHLEHRLYGAQALASHGIISLEDLLSFDHVAFHNRMQRMHILPSQAELGVLLASITNEPHSSADAALRKRARTWQKRYMVDENFCLHNALRGTPKLIAKLSEQSFTDWLKLGLAIH